MVVPSCAVTSTGIALAPTRQLAIRFSKVAFELGIGFTGVTPFDKNCPAAGVARNVRRVKTNAMI